MRVIESKPSAEVSALMLEQAKVLRRIAGEIERGEVLALSVAWIGADETVGTSWVAECRKFLLMGAMTALQWEVAQAVDRDC